MHVSNLHALIIIHSINHIHYQWNTNAPDDNMGVSSGARTYVDDRDKTDGRPDVRVNFFYNWYRITERFSMVN